MAITVFMCDSFDHQAVALAPRPYTGTVTGSPGVSATARTGSAALQINTSAAAERVSYNPGTGIRVAAQSFAIRFVSSLPGADASIAYIAQPNGNAELRFDAASDRFECTVQNTDPQLFGPNPIVADTWYLIVMEFDSTTGTSTHRARCFDASTGSLIGSEATSSRVQVAADFTAMLLGTLSAQTMNVLYDDWIMSITDGDYENWEAPFSVASLQPVADGTHNISGANIFERTATGTDITNSTTDAYLLISGSTIDQAAADFIRQVGAGVSDYTETIFGNVPAGTPQGVRGLSIDKDASATSTSANVSRVLDSSDGVATPNLRLAADDPGTTITLRSKMLAPASGSWTTAKLTGAKLQWGFGDGTPDSDLASALLEVALFPAAGGSLVAPPPAIRPLLVR